MGFACPVCEIPHQDATHLANHLAFTAMTHGDDHEAWLDDHVPEWAGYGEAELAAAVEDLAPEAEYEQVFEDTVRARGGVGGDHGHAHSHDGSPAGIDPGAAAATGRGDLDEAARAVLEEARELTAEMLTEDDDRDASGTDADEGRTDPEGDGRDGAPDTDADDGDG
ncbi:DUF5810 domain-containing protein [Halobellus ruber]|uniref:Uncharacterized protein n=1 Tax=Halobellus ruber TaxID=2761102 RepID=A0A7J9SJI8_9EURY|nr:DUF5810 domain-containing protein [Halobellus ruber]MBB6647104.1 hypothetical protein [Halobellus ruber]